MHAGDLPRPHFAPAGTPDGDIPSKIARAYQATELHIRGETFEDIKRICGFKTILGTQRAVSTILGRAFRPGVKKQREAQRRRLEKLLKVYTPFAMGTPANPATGEPEVPPNLEAAEFCRKIIRELRDLDGIDRPKKVNIKSTHTSTSVEVLVADLKRQGMPLPRGMEHLQLPNMVLDVVPTVKDEVKENAE